MASEEHQILVNALAKALEEQRGVTITHVDIDGDSQFFDEKYRELPTPGDHGGMPDLQGKDTKGLLHLGEAEIDIDDENVEAQLKAFSNRVMNGTETKVPLHVIVPNGLRDQMENKIREIGLGDKLRTQIFVWS